MSADAASADRAPQFHDARQRRHSTELGMWVFLASEIMFFGALFAGYVVSRFDESAAFAAASRHTDVALGTLNTALLLTSSYTIALALFTLRADKRRTALSLLLATVVLGMAFLAIKGVEYRHDYIEGLVPWLDFRFDPAMTHGAAVFFYLYFVMTGVHAVHVTIGIAVVLVMAVRVYRYSLTARYASPLEASALYWHLVDVVWIFLYPALYLVGRAG